MCHLDADYRKDAQAHGIHHQHQSIVEKVVLHHEALDRGKENYESSDDGKGGVDRITKGVRRCDAQHKVANDSSANSCGQPQNHDTQNVHLLFQTCDGS